MTIVIIIFCASCKQTAENNSMTSANSLATQDIPSDFLDFYMKFHQDSLFQIAHIIFPLKEKENGDPWLKEEWIMHKSFDDHGGQFERQFVNLKGIIIEGISSGNGMVTIERRYIENGDSYSLIYYKTTNAFNNSEDWEKGQ